LRHLPLMISVGVGMCLSNTLAVLRGLTRRKFEFRRTPKFSVLKQDRSWKKKGYRSTSLKAGWVELLFTAYFVGAFWLALVMNQWISLPFIAMFGFGFAYVAFLSLAHGVASWARPAFLPTPSPEL
jgi:hypothetical protein